MFMCSVVNVELWTAMIQTESIYFMNEFVFGVIFRLRQNFFGGDFARKRALAIIAMRLMDIGMKQIPEVSFQVFFGIFYGKAQKRILWGSLVVICP